MSGITLFCGCFYQIFWLYLIVCVSKLCTDISSYLMLKDTQVFPCIQKKKKSLNDTMKKALKCEVVNGYGFNFFSPTN